MRAVVCTSAFGLLMLCNSFWGKSRGGHRHENHARSLTTPVELREHIGAIASTKIDDAVAIAGAVLQFIGQLLAEFTVRLDPHVGIESAQPFEICVGWKGHHHAILERAQNAA